MDGQNLPALRITVAHMVKEYEAKRGAIPAELLAFKQAQASLEMASTLGGTYGGGIWGRYGSSAPSEATLADSLLQSAWAHVIKALQIRSIATAKDLAQLETSLTNPPEFTIENIFATFGRYGENPRHHVLRGVAECFTELDPAYRSHSKVKIGVSGLPQRIVIDNALSGYGGHWREGQMRNVLDALATLHGEERMGYVEFSALCEAAKRGDCPEFLGVTVKGFKNGNAHLHFDREAQKVINLALAEFYGDVLPDVEEERPQRRASTEVSADLAYYPTPAAVAARLVSSVHWPEGGAILEPSCGCGRILDALRAHNRTLRLTGIEVHGGRAAEARAKGHHVQQANFLQVAPQPIFDGVVMNPPFSGRHYLKHIRHALRFLKPGGALVAILPSSAWYDHGELPRGSWSDLPVASFAESGTNVPTGIFTTSAPRA